MRCCPSCDRPLALFADRLEADVVVERTERRSSSTSPTLPVRWWRRCAESSPCPGNDRDVRIISIVLWPLPLLLAGCEDEAPWPCPALEWLVRLPS